MIVSLLWTPAAAFDLFITNQTNEVVVKTLADSPVRGHLRSFSLEDGLTLKTVGEDAPATIAGDEIVQIVMNHARAAGWFGSGVQPTTGLTAPVELQLVGGDRLFGKPVRAEDGTEHSRKEEVVLIETAALGTIQVPLSSIDCWINTSRPLSLNTQHSALSTQDSVEDCLLLANGDVVYGILLSIDDRGLTFESEGASMTVRHSQVATVDLVADPPLVGDGLRARISFVDGARLTTDDVCYADGKLEFRLPGDVRRTVGLDRIARIDVSGGRWIWLTELEPISVQHAPMLSLSWPYVEDANVLGGPMRVENRAFEHGLGVHSASSLIYDLTGKYEWFVTYFGIDDSASGEPGLADVTAEIRIDGQVHHCQEHVTAGKLWGPIRIDVGGAARIELRVLFGDNASIQDRFNWAGAGLIRVK